jgi:hypothetical protein
MDNQALWNRIKQLQDQLDVLRKNEFPVYAEGTWVPTFPLGFSAAPAGGLYRYILTGKLCTLFVRMPNNGTSNAGTFQMIAPFTSADVDTNMVWGNALLSCVDNGAVLGATGNAYIANNSNVIIIQKLPDGTAWTASGGKRANFTLSFEIP